MFRENVASSGGNNNRYRSVKTASNTALRVMIIRNTNCFPMRPRFFPDTSISPTFRPTDLIIRKSIYSRISAVYRKPCLLQTPAISVFRRMFASIMLTRLVGLISVNLLRARDNLYHMPRSNEVVAFPPVCTHRLSRTRRVSTELNSNLASLLANPSLSSLFAPYLLF